MTTLIEISTTVNFNRSTGRWDASNGRLLRNFPAGPAGKQAAHMFALQTDCPDVAKDIADLLKRYADHPKIAQIAARAIRGGELLRDGHILRLELFRNGNPKFIEAEVQSQSGDRSYIIRHNLSWICECIDWDNGRAISIGWNRKFGAPALEDKGLFCKHGAAVSFRLNQLRRIAKEQKELALLRDEAIERMVEEKVYGRDY